MFNFYFRALMTLASFVVPRGKNRAIIRGVILEGSPDGRWGFKVGFVGFCDKPHVSRVRIWPLLPGTA